MYRPIFQLRSQLRHQHTNFISLPLRLASQETHANPLQSLNMRQQLEFANFLQCLVFGPRVRRRLQRELLDVHESSLFEHVQILIMIGHWSIVGSGGIANEARPV